MERSNRFNAVMFVIHSHDPALTLTYAANNSSGKRLFKHPASTTAGSELAREMSTPLHLIE